MKALKEKRIRIRSLWRMGLVVLSVFALAFVACGKSDSGEPATPPLGPGGLTSTVVPVDFTIDSKPLAASGNVHEGQVINLAGISLNVRYSDNHWEQTTDLTKIKVEPAVYIWGYNFIDANGYINPGPNPGYTISFSDKGTVLEKSVPRDYLGYHMKLLDLDVTGQMNKQEYLIDDIPNYAGLTVNGVYSAANVLAWPNGDVTQSDYYRLPIPLSTDIKEHRWAWVWNATSGIGSFRPDDDPGVLISIGSMGGILSMIKGTGSITTTQSYLMGKRIEISKLHQVKDLAWDPEPAYPDPIFYDDPTLIGSVFDSALLTPGADNNAALRAVEEWQTKWFDNVFMGAKIKVIYTNDQSNTYNLRDIRTMNQNYGYDLLQNFGTGGTWANLEFYPISRAGKKIDITKDSKAIVGAGDGITVNDFDMTNYIGKWGTRDYDFEDVTGAAIGGYGVINGDGGWSQWAQLGADYTKLRFFWRGKFLDTTAKVYNRPASMAVTVKEGYANPPLIMNGYDYVYQRPEGMAAFLAKLTVSVTYTRQGGADTDTATRPDVALAQANGTCRSFIPLWFTPSEGNSTTKPTLYSTNIFNWKENDDLYPQLARLSQDGTYVSKFTAAQGSILNKTQSDLFVNRQREVAARIFYEGFSGNPLSTRTVNNRDIMIGVTGYIKDPVDGEDNLR